MVSARVGTGSGTWTSSDLELILTSLHDGLAALHGVDVERPLGEPIAASHEARAELVLGADRNPVRIARPGERRSTGWRWPLPEPLRSLRSDVDDRLARLPTRLNEYGYDPFGFDPEWGRSLLLTMGMLYRYWLR